MKTVDVIIERGSDGTFDANMETYSDLEFGLLGQGKTVEEAKADLMNSYNEIKEIFVAMFESMDNEYLCFYIGRSGTYNGSESRTIEPLYKWSAKAQCENRKKNTGTHSRICKESKSGSFRLISTLTNT